MTDEVKTENVEEVKMETRAVKENNQNFWKNISAVSSLIAVVAVVLLVQAKMPSSYVKVLSQDEVSTRIASLVDASTAGAEKYTLTSIEEVNGLYDIKFVLDGADGSVDQELKITKDGELLVMQSALYSEIMAQIEQAKQQEIVIPPIDENTVQIDETK